MVLVTKAMVRAAKDADACEEGVEGVEAGMDITELSFEQLAWAEDELANQFNVVAIVDDIIADSGIDCEVLGTISLRLLGRYGYGYGDGEGS